MNSRFASRKLYVTWLGWIIVLSGIICNEFVLASLFSTDGVLEPVDQLQIRIFNMLLIALGLTVLFLRNELSHDEPLTKILRTYPRSSAVAIGTVIAVMLLLIIELGFYLLNATFGEDSGIIKITGDKPWVIQDDLLGYKPKPNTEITYRSEIDGRLVYEVIYSFDALGRRITPHPVSKDRKRFILFFGGSFTFGEGVQAHETLPGQIVTLTRDVVAYNYGFRGYGPQQMLEQLRSHGMRRDVNEKEGDVVYIAIDHHVLRLIGSMRISAGNRSVFPYFTVGPDGNLVRQGNFATGRPFRQLIYMLLARSQVLRFFQVDWPPIGERELRLMARVIEASRDTFQKKFDGEFYIVIYPGSRLLKDVIPLLEQRSISVLDYSELFDPGDRQSKNRYRILGDGHPTPLAYSMVARQLQKDLHLESTDTSWQP